MGALVTKQTVLDFTRRFQNEGTIKTFTEGCCYWFAFILAHRFDGTLMYHPIRNHFAVDIEGVLYDITGELEMDEHWATWARYFAYDPKDSYRIVRDCIWMKD